jgi:hypothetical protein
VRPPPEPPHAGTESELPIQAIPDLSRVRNLQAIVEIVRHAARALAGSDGATFVLREGDRCRYVDEDAIGPLWKGCRFPMAACISRWCMHRAEATVIEDIYGGRIGAEQEPAAGALFCFTLPKAQPEATGSCSPPWPN